MINNLDFISVTKEKLVILLAQANEFKEGDLQNGGTNNELIRQKAREMLGSMTLSQITSIQLIDDQVTMACKNSTNPSLSKEIENLTFSDLKSILLSEACTAWVQKYAKGLQSEVIAGVVKLMTNSELSVVSKKLHISMNTITGEMASEEKIIIGSHKHFGSRLQPNSPGDDPEEILLSILEGLTYGCGDVILGINPASDRVEDIATLEKLLMSIVTGLKLPTRYCVLSDMIKQVKAKQISNADIGFQSLCGTSKGLVGMLGVDVLGLAKLCKNFNGLYFETGQGSAVTNMVSEGIDMVTLEARCYGLARYLIQQSGSKWAILNDVSGFIGPEVYKTKEQLFRACLEDTVMGKLHGLVMGLDVCSTFHMGIDPFELQDLTEKIVEVAEPVYLMGVAGKADPMLGYLTTAFKEHPRIRNKYSKEITTDFSKRLSELGITKENFGKPELVNNLYCKYRQSLGDLRKSELLIDECHTKMTIMKIKGFDLGTGYSAGMLDPLETTNRLKQIYQNAKEALTAKIKTETISKCCPSFYNASTFVRDRDSYISCPALGEQISESDAANIQKIYENKRPQVLFVISDGLNGNAVNEHLVDLVSEIRGKLNEMKFDIGNTDIVIKNGRVRAGYHCGMLTKSNLIIHFIGERPGTGLNQLSVYITYGNDGELSKWSISMDHSLTTAICGIHPKGKTIIKAEEEIVECVKNAFKFKTTGVSLSEKINN